MQVVLLNAYIADLFDLLSVLSVFRAINVRTRTLHGWHTARNCIYNADGRAGVFNECILKQLIFHLEFHQSV
jgi:hypothetical protein